MTPDRFAALRKRIAAIPRIPLALRPTPMVEAKRLARQLGGPRIFVKRDDLTGIALGGNKLRNLEFRLAHAVAQGADTIIVGLDLQSNSARQTTGAANSLGLRTVLVLEGAPPAALQGNLLLDHLLGADVRLARDAAEQRAMLDAAADEVRAAGGRPYMMSDDPMFEMGSALAYLDATLEMLEQLAPQGVAPRAFYLSSGGKGQAGMALARAALGADFAVRGVTASRRHDVPTRTAAIANRTAEKLGLDARVSPDDVINTDAFVGLDYGIPTEAGNEALLLFARHEGVLLDPVYTGKAAACLIADIRAGLFGAEDAVVFVHTGGMPAIFTWSEALLAAARGQ
ncbi:pyridoxal-phosphate dependent enzyme [Roseomonas sp. AR75]|uniref:pyridoxal-phosphate dependent enzyme n=1 Tax=Roseomonas sp. AR75 TaxID=2562311 RepID=UPI001981B550|nr:pyridoxal-phosphate dependent enzyme [Roseomonas sp. AR75]